MKRSIDVVHLLHMTSRHCLSHLRGEQNAITRFVWCCVDKIFLCTTSLKTLIPQLEQNVNNEFSIGIILRSMLMDGILIQRLVSILHNHTVNGQIELTGSYVAIDKQSLIYLADGTMKLIDMLYGDDRLTLEQRITVCRNMANTFPGAFDTTGEKPKRNTDFKLVNLQNEYEAIVNKEETARIIYNNYNIYSKYDHVSHWSSELQTMSIDNRKHRIESSLFMIMLSLREILKLPYLYNPQHKDSMIKAMNQIDDFAKGLDDGQS